MTQATAKQVGFISKLLSERVFDEYDAAAVSADIKARSGKTIDSSIDLNDLASLTSLEASKLISALLEAPTKKAAAAKAERTAANMDRHAALVTWAKENGVKATTRTSAATIRRNILDAGLEIPAEFTGKVADSKGKRERMTF